VEAAATKTPSRVAEDDSKLIRKVGQTRFAFLVAKKLDMYAELDLDVLIPKGSTSFKDIDNKLKTVCDAFSLPGQAPRNSTAGDGIQPFKYLLEDDHLIYRLNVNTEYLLASETFELSNRQTMWIINVRIRGNRFDESYKDLIV